MPHAASRANLEAWTRAPAAPIEGGNFVSGRSARPSGAPAIEVRSPQTGALLGSVPDSDPAAVARVVSGASEAARSWRSLPIKERSAFLFRFRELVLRHLHELA